MDIHLTLKRKHNIFADHSQFLFTWYSPIGNIFAKYGSRILPPENNFVNGRYVHIYLSRTARSCLSYSSFKTGTKLSWSFLGNGTLEFQLNSFNLVKSLNMLQRFSNNILSVIEVASEIYNEEIKIIWNARTFYQKTQSLKQLFISQCLMRALSLIEKLSRWNHRAKPVPYKFSRQAVLLICNMESLHFDRFLSIKTALDYMSLE